MLKEETIKELKMILKEDYGCDLSLKEATEAADILVRFFDLLVKTYYQNQRSKEIKINKFKIL